MRSTSVCVLVRGLTSRAMRTRCVQLRHGLWDAVVRARLLVCMPMCRAFRVDYRVLHLRLLWGKESGFSQARVEMESTQPFLVVERPYAVSQSERAEAKRICACPGVGARFATNADRLLALKAKLVGSCCVEGQTAKLYGSVPKPAPVETCCQGARMVQ